MVGVRVRSFSTTLVQALGQVSVTYAYLDLEHAGFSPYDSNRLEQMQLATNHADISLVVRLPDTEPSMVRKVLDAGIRTIIIPRVKSASQVRRVVEASQYEYDGGSGERGFGTAPVNNWGVRPPEYTQQEDDTTLVGIMLETSAAVEEAQEITSISGLGFAKIGVGDLSVSLGCPQEFDTPELQTALETLEDACRTNGVPLGRGVSSAEEAAEAIQDGYQLVDIGGMSKSSEPRYKIGSVILNKRISFKNKVSLAEQGLRHPFYRGSVYSSAESRGS